jgi:hypothetical protein
LESATIRNPDYRSRQVSEDLGKKRKEVKEREHHPRTPSNAAPHSRPIERRWEKAKKEEEEEEEEEEETHINFVTDQGQKSI